jgi:hypothetical protein
MSALPGELQDRAQARIEKVAVPVRVTLATGVTHGGEVFLEPHQRIIDMFNDGTSAFMFKSETAAGERQIWMIAKRHVVEIEALKMNRTHPT